MCENPDKIIKIDAKTDKGKYEFLKNYYTLWNFVLKTSPSAIVDTHAGTGLVQYGKTNKKVYGSPILALLKTVHISNNLKVILNEKNTKNYQVLNDEINKIITDGVRVFRSIHNRQYLISGYFPYHTPLSIRTCSFQLLS